MNHQLAPSRETPPELLSPEARTRRMVREGLPLAEKLLARARFRNGKPAADPELRSAVLEALWRATVRYRTQSDASFQTYVGWRMAGAIKDFLGRRYHAKDAYYRCDRPLASLRARAHEVPSVEEGVSARLQVQRLLEEAAAQLDATSLRILTGLAVEGFTGPELAEELGLSRHQVRYRYGVALALLRRLAERRARRCRQRRSRFVR